MRVKLGRSRPEELYAFGRRRETSRKGWRVCSAARSIVSARTSASSQSIVVSASSRRPAQPGSCAAVITGSSSNTAPCGCLRVAAEGLVGLAIDGSRGALVEVNSETDFVARNEGFQAFVRQVAELALDAASDLDALAGAAYPGSGRSVAEELAHLIGIIGENMILRRTDTLSVGQGTVAGYVHNQAAPGLGKIGVLVALDSPVDALSTMRRRRGVRRRPW